MTACTFHPWRLARSAVLLGLLAACRSGAPSPEGSASASAAASTSAVPASTTTTLAASSTVSAAPFDEVASAACAARRAAVAAEPAVPGAPTFEKNRIELVGRVRGTPLLWLRAPAVGSSRAAQAFDEKLRQAKRPLAVVKDVLYRYAKRPDELRDIVLREGYAYAEEPEIGLALIDMLRLTQLFREPQIYLVRGGLLHRLERQPRARFTPERYVHADGPLAGRQAELLLGDRVGTDPSVARDPLAVDIIGAQQADGFDRLRPTRLTSRALSAELRYGTSWVPALLDVDAGRATLGCLEMTAEQASARADYLQHTNAWRRAFRKIRETVRDAVEEEPVFDEPRDEAEGEQQDGMLRREWRRAYLAGKRRFEVGNHRYEVYDRKGRPVPPQVCTDFITDTWERASGTWWAPLEPPKPGQKLGDTAPKRLLGGIQLGKQEELDNVRSVVELVRFAAKHSEMFEVWDVPDEGRIPFRDRARFFQYLADNADRFRLGDVYIIFGMKGGKPHYHSMMIMEADPVTGVTTLIASNAVRPREQTLDGIMRISPHRTVKHVLRPRPDYFADAILGAGG